VNGPSPATGASEDVSIGVDALVARRRAGFALEQPFYLSDAVFRADVERVFLNAWLYAGHVSEIPHAGDYLTYEFGDASVLLVRAQDGAIHALANVCRHRGSRICMEHSGHVGKIVCPYHQWIYDHDGRLLAAKHMPADFDRSEHGLKKVHLRNLEGLLFVCLGDSAPDFSGIERDLAPQLRPHALANAKIAHRITYPMKANWKLAMENWRECYHCAVGHPEFCKVTGADRTFASARNRAQYDRRESEWRDKWNREGLLTKQVRLDPPSTFYTANRYALADGNATESMDGKPVAPLMGDLQDPEAGTLGVNIFPIFSVQVHSDYAFVLNMKPIDAARTSYETLWLVRADAQEGRDYDLKQLTEFWRITAEQDVALVEWNQLGVRSPHYAPGPLSTIEREYMEKFIEWYLWMMGACHVTQQ